MSSHEDTPTPFCCLWIVSIREGLVDWQRPPAGRRKYCKSASKGRQKPSGCCPRFPLRGGHNQSPSLRPNPFASSSLTSSYLMSSFTASLNICLALAMAASPAFILFSEKKTQVLWGFMTDPTWEISNSGLVQILQNHPCYVIGQQTLRPLE